MMAHPAATRPGTRRETPPPRSSACAGGVSEYISPHKADSKFSKTSSPQYLHPVESMESISPEFLVPFYRSVFHGCEPYTYMLVPKFFENNIQEDL